MDSRSSLRPLAAILTLLVSLALAASANAAGWQPQGQLSGPGVDVFDSHTAAAPDGSTWVVWDGDDKVQIERVAADGTKSPVKDVSSGFPEQEAVVSESNGDALVAWWESDGVFVREVQPDGTLGTSRLVSDSGGSGPLALTIDGSDVATVAYTEEDSTHNIFMLWARRVVAGVPSGSPIQISTNNKENVEQLSMSTNSAGDSVLAWGYSNTIDNSGIDAWARRIRRLGADGTLGTEHELDGLQAGSAVYESTAITPAGDGYAAWVQIPLGGGQQGDLKVAKLDASDTLSSLGTLDSHADDFEAEPWLTTDPSGNLTTVWATEDQTSFDDQLVSRRISSSGTIDPPLTADPDALSPSDTSFGGDWTLTELPDGTADVAWYDEDETPTMQSAIIDPASGPGAPQTIGNPTDFIESLSAAADKSGNVFLAYSHTPDFNSNSEDGVFYDVQGPAVDDFAVPSAGTVGDDLVFGSSASDRSGVQSYAWDFGDGGNATGPIADHTYTAPGTYTVKLSTTDHAGNTTSTTRTLTVRSASSGSGPGGGGTPQPGGLRASFTGIHRTFHLGRNRTITLHLPAEPVDAFGSLSVRAEAGGAARLVTLASRRFPVFRGKPLRLRVKLPARTVKLARRHHGRVKVRLRLVLTGFDRNSAARTYTLTLRTR